MRSLPVLITPCLPCSRSISSDGLRMVSDGLSVTSKCSRRRLAMSGKVARVTRTDGRMQDLLVFVWWRVAMTKRAGDP